MKPINRELLLKVRAAILKGPKNFDYKTYINLDYDIEEAIEKKCYTYKEYKLESYDLLTKHTCGTSACVAGWTIALSDDKSDLLQTEFLDNGELAALKLGLSHEESEMLFFCRALGPFEYIPLIDATAEDAVKRIDYILSEENEKRRNFEYIGKITQ